MAEGQRERQSSVFWQAFGVFGTIAIMLGVLSLSNLIIRGFNLGVAVPIRDLVNAYVLIFHDVTFGLIEEILKIELLPILKDILVFYFIGYGIILRHLRTIWVDQSAPFWEIATTSVLWPFWYLLTFVNLSPKIWNEKMRRSLMIQTATIMGGVLLLLLANAGLQAA